MTLFDQLRTATRSVFVSAAVWVSLLLIVGASLLTAGTYALAGPGWALIVGGALCMVIAALILKGLSSA